MKKCFLFAVILLAAGCFAPDPALQKEWAPADRTYDSLARQLESSQDARNGGELLAKLRTRRDQLPDNPVLGWRTRYWEAAHSCRRADGTRPWNCSAMQSGRSTRHAIRMTGSASWDCKARYA